MMFTRGVRLGASPFLVFFLLLLALCACKFPGQTTPTATPTVNHSVVITQVAQTVQATLFVPTPTVQILLPTNTLPPLTLSPSTLPPPTEPPATPTPLSSPTPTTTTVQAKVDTNCHSGPDVTYPTTGYLLAGQQSTVAGRNSTRTWWYIQNPSQPGAYCWVWSRSTQILGDALNLPVVTPPPLEPTTLPRTSATVTFSNVHQCNGLLTAIFKVVNTGKEALKSTTLWIVDINNGANLIGPIDKNAPFMQDSSDCPWGGYNLPDGETGYLGGRLSAAAKSKHLAVADITLCAAKDLLGECVHFRIQFKIP
jgi:hypothetical protein